MRDYAELIKDLRESAEWSDRLAVLMGRDVGDSKAPLMRKAADAIEELLDELTTIRKQLPHWVSVEERLPEKSKIVLVAYDNGVVAQGMLFFGKFRGANFGFDENDEPIIAEVTHWMPLPEPWKAKLSLFSRGCLTKKRWNTLIYQEKPEAVLKLSEKSTTAKTRLLTRFAMSIRRADT